MSQGTRSVRSEGDESHPITPVRLSPVEPDVAGAKSREGDPTTYFRNVTNSVVQDALNVWSEIWGELEGDVACGAVVVPDDEGPESQNGAMGTPNKGFTPSCGWPAFLEKMWVLRQNLDFLARFSRQ